MSEERLKEIKEELAKISFSNIGHCVNTNLILDYITNLQEEIERLNNIINELEKWLVEWREMLDCPDFYEEGIIDCINDTLTELQELKGSDK